MSNNQKLYYLLLFIFGAIFFVLNINTPFMHDDYAYCFFYDADSYTIRPTGERVTGFIQMLQSMWHHYLCVNGRFVSHTVLQSFCAFFGKTAFNICNAFVFILFLDVIVRIARQKNSILTLLITFLATMCLLPFPGQTMLWMTGAINYLWPATATLWLLYWLKVYTPSTTVWYKHILIFLGCLAIAWTQESITAPVAAGLFFYFLFNRKRFKGYAVSATIGYCIGAILTVFGPGTFARLGRGSDISTDMDMVQFMFQHTYAFTYSFVHVLLPLLAVILGIVALVRSKQIVARFKTSIYGWIFCCFCLFLMALGMYEERVYFGVSCLSLVIILISIASVINKLQKHWYVSAALLLVAFLPSYKAICATSKYRAYNERTVLAIQKAPDECVIEALPSPGDSRYVYATTVDADRFNFHNRVRAFYYGKKYVQALPSSIFEAIIDGSFQDKLEIVDMSIDGRPVYKFDNYLAVALDTIPSKRLEAKYFFLKPEPENSKVKALAHYLFNTRYTFLIKSTFVIINSERVFLLMPYADRVRNISVITTYY